MMTLQLEGLRRENKNLGQEIKDLADQLGDGGRTAHEMQKMVRRLEIEKEELQVSTVLQYERRSLIDWSRRCRGSPSRGGEQGYARPSRSLPDSSRY